MDINFNNNNDAPFWVAFSYLSIIGPVRFKKLMDFFGSAGAAWQANAADLISAGFEEKIADKIIIERSEVDVDKKWDELQKTGINICLFSDKQYPFFLKNIFDPPFILYYQGSLNIVQQCCLAVVGTRKFSTYGKQATHHIIRELSGRDITIVSGLAIGIDAIAHQACLENNIGTAGVLGSGVDWPSVYPMSNRNLAKNIVSSGGCILSEYPIGTPALKHHFPLRNRIISGLSRAVLVIEAKENSGSLITANCALDQSRDVFAVPGNIFHPTCRGNNLLIQKGARLISSGHDIIEEFNMAELEQKIINQTVAPVNSEEELILNLLSHEPLHVDKIAQTCKLKINALSAILTIMELKGMIKDAG